MLHKVVRERVGGILGPVGGGPFSIARKVLVWLNRSQNCSRQNFRNRGYHEERLGFDPSDWKQFKFFALVQPEGHIFPVRTVYDGVTQNIGNNYLSSDTPLWFAGCDVIASAIRTKKAPRILRAVRLVSHGKQAGMKSVNLRGSMVEIDPYREDLFRKLIEQRKLHKPDKALYYWLKIPANSIYGFFVELIPELQKKNVSVKVFSGEAHFTDSSDVLENPGPWFFAPLASLITSAGRLFLAMAEACVDEKKEHSFSATRTPLQS